jgi:hypothetical protein
MSNDPIVDEIRETRRRIFEERGNDLHRLIERLKASGARHKNRLVTIENVHAQARSRKAALE